MSSCTEDPAKDLEWEIEALPLRDDILKLKTEEL